MTDHLITAASGAVIYEGQTPSLLHHQAAGLVKHAQALARLSIATQPPDQTALIIATYLTAAAAIEAILCEAAHDYVPDLYAECEFRKKAGAPSKYERLMHASAPDELMRIWRIRNALTHSEPTDGRLGEAGNHINTDGASNAATYVEQLLHEVQRELSRPAS